MLSIRQELDCETTSISKMTVSAPESKRANTELGEVLHQKEELVQLQHTHITYITRYPNNPNAKDMSRHTRMQRCRLPAWGCVLGLGSLA